MCFSTKSTQIGAIKSPVNTRRFWVFIGSVFPQRFCSSTGSLETTFFYFIPQLVWAAFKQSHKSIIIQFVVFTIHIVWLYELSTIQSVRMPRPSLRCINQCAQAEFKMQIESKEVQYASLLVSSHLLPLPHRNDVYSFKRKHSMKNTSIHWTYATCSCGTETVDFMAILLFFTPHRFFP